MRLVITSGVVLFLFFQSQCQTQFNRKWILMSIDNLNTGVKKEIGQYVHAELNFDSDSTYKGVFCNSYQATVQFNEDKTCKMSAPIAKKHQCMGFADVEAELFRLYPLVIKYSLKNNALFLFTSEQKRLVFRSE